MNPINKPPAKDSNKPAVAPAHTTLSGVQAKPQAAAPPARDTVKPPNQAAQQDRHDLQTPPQQQQSMPSMDSMKGQWKQQVGAAKIMWGKLTEDELLKIEGHQQKLAGLVQERYAVSRDEADRQVKKFFDKNKS